MTPTQPPVGRPIDPTTAFAPALSGHDQDVSEVFRPRFGADGLLTAIAVDAADGTILMVAHMNAEALAATLSTGRVHYFSRSRQRLWMKGETSGQIQTVVELATDCDQDAVIVRVTVGGDGNSCHTGALSCFYRRVLPVDPDDPAGPLRLAPRDVAVPSD